VKVLATLAAAVAFGAQSNDASLTQTQGDDGLYRVQISVHYGFPGLPPRTNNSGVGTVRFTLPDGDVKVDSVDTGYQCATEGPGTVLCQNDAQPQEGGTAFPPSMTLNLISQNCLSQSGSADVWAAEKDPGGAPDGSFVLQPRGCDTTDPSAQPVLDTKETCKVPNVKGMTVAAATREITAGDCLKGRVTFAYSKKVKKGRVIKQSQRPGKTLTFRSKVNLTVSKGKRK